MASEIQTLNVVNTEHQQALNKTKLQLLSTPDSVFFTTLCFSLKTSFDNSIPTAATNGKWIKFNTVFFMELSPAERVFLLIHEAMHCAYLHMSRGVGYKQRIFNIACDHVINLQLIKRGFKMPAHGYADSIYEGLSAEQIYAILIAQPEPPPNPMDNDVVPGDQSSDQLEEDIQNILMRAAMQSKMSSDKIGSIPGEIQIYLDHLLKPKLPWNRILQKYLFNFAKNDYTFRKPNRRFFPKYHLPSLFSNKLMDIAIAIDISGSVSNTDFQRFVTETHSILKMMQPDKISLIQFDTDINSVHTIKTVRQLMDVKFIGQGGTYINPVLDWANENKPQLLLVFTDGHFHFYTTETKVNMLWLINDNPQFNAPFGKTIHYSMEN